MALFLIGLIVTRFSASQPQLQNDIQKPRPLHCRVRGVLPDPECTPGAIDPHVTQMNIQETICQVGYTKTVRPSTSVTNPIKQHQLLMYGLPQSMKDYELDHLIPLTIGGASADEKNLWPEAYIGTDGARKKDSLEKKLNTLVCQGTVTLHAAQQAIATDWLQAYVVYIPQ